MTLTRSVTTKKFAMDFSQQKRDLNAEQKKTAALEQCFKEMESALTAGKISRRATLSGAQRWVFGYHGVGYQHVLRYTSWDLSLPILVT
jgi:hypothetical protein